ncbi:MAG TPA: AAA family ATPase [Candidatus Baltobacteraceae bacterium]|nr:AAA family ATPase [Candidatus Baltobacteraceae bacterium]
MSEDIKRKATRPTPTITRIAVTDYKSIGTECSMEIKPLTVLAGANSSGKSSIVQPLLLLKQTLEATYDPGALKLTGANVRYSSGEQLLCKIPSRSNPQGFSVAISTGKENWRCHYIWIREKGFELAKMEGNIDGKPTVFSPGTQITDIDQLSSFGYPKDFLSGMHFEWSTVRDRCFIQLQGRRKESKSPEIKFPLVSTLANTIRGIIHLPGLRGNPERTYPVTAVADTFSGTFQEYTASVIADWQASSEKGKLANLGKELMKLSLTWKVMAIPQNDTQVELKVGRLPHPIRGGARDLVSIADVGLGVSQTLPVLVALHVAKPGQLVFLEQPEIHLHPRAQMALANVLASAANRDVVVIVETHSSILLRGIQTAVAEKRICSEKVSLNWFNRNEDSGQTECVAGTLDKSGAFGNWPEDFDEITLESEKRFMDANEASQNREHAIQT